MRIVVAVVALAACGPSSPGASSPGANVIAKNVSATDGMAVSAACTPTGPEICFNANDDNCNGVIDEGCGVGTGVLQFTVAWGDSVADVDLAVSEPSGLRIHKENPSAAGLRLEKNCPEDDCHQQNIENIFYDGAAEPAHGRYVAEVKLTDAKGADLPVKVHFSARVGSRTWAMDLSLSPQQGKDRQGFSFEL